MSFSLKKLPQYSLKDEIWNSITHLVGFLFSLGVLIFFIIKNISAKTLFLKMCPFYVYALTMMIVFLVSTLYHSSRFNNTTRLVFRILDHSDIYLFVFGTYLPICLYGMTGKALGIPMIITLLVFTVIGVLINTIPYSNKILKAIGYIIYIVEGWALLLFMPFGVRVHLNVFWPVLIGGIVYSIGAILYAVGKKKKFFHTIFHIFVLLGAIIQFVGIYNLLIFNL